MSTLEYEGLSLENVPYFEKDRFWVSPMNYTEGVHSNFSIPKKIEFHDVTLRDGEQTPGVVFKEDERIRLAQALDEVGVSRIEFGMPIVSEDIANAFKTILKMNLRAEIVAFGRTHRDDIDLALKLGCKSIIAEHCTNPFLCRDVYKLDHRQTVERITESIKIAKTSGLKVYFMGWDASRVNLEYLRKLYLDIVDKVVPDSIIFVDTFGVMTPWAMLYTIRKIKEWLPNVKIEVHNHNGFGFGTANSVAAMLGGATCLHTSINGLGEREGNIPIEEIALALELIFKVKTGIDLKKLIWLSKLAIKISGFKIADNKPVVGPNYFKFEPGVAIQVQEAMKKSGLGKVGLAFTPSVLGKSDYDYTFGKNSGGVSIRLFLSMLGMNATEEQVSEILDIVKRESNIRKGTIDNEEMKMIVERVVNR